MIKKKKGKNERHKGEENKLLKNARMRETAKENKETEDNEE